MTATAFRRSVFTAPFVVATLVSMTALSRAPASAAEPAADPAVAFGSMPALWNARISPDGSRIAFLQMHPEDLPILRVFDLETSEAGIALVSVPKEFDLRWCDWANDERLLCGYGGIDTSGRTKFPRTRLVAADADGGRQEVPLQLKLREYVQFQHHVVDWPVDDPKHVLVGIPSRNGMGVDRLDIETRGTREVEKARRNARYWMSDNRGTPRMFMYNSAQKRKWYARPAEGGPWRISSESDVADLDHEYWPLGFAEDPNTLLVIKPSKGRLALWSEPLDDPSAAELVFSHPDVDVGDPLVLGKYRRMVAVGYTTDKSPLFYFDAAIEKIAAEIGVQFPDRNISVFDESWDRKRYLVHVGSDTDPGSIYLYDTADKSVRKIADQYPPLAGGELARMQPLRYAALMSAIEEGELYRCVVSIAGVTDPATLLDDARHFLSWRGVRSFVGTEKEALEAGSPLRRAAELKVPALLFHGDEDVNVTVEHSRKLANALRRAGGDVAYVEYEEVEHSISRNALRIDLLRRVGDFLDANLRTADSTPEL